ncbi:MAG TPA: pyruvate dehydrogenase complex dihydrolipoamide acetyltransferase [Saprospiraceae bacterium]|nr:pyruvate dehydrogenase complex dihydrolipoamide acetyltransferase [Saprospiraceae bacterium]
MAEVIRMPRLSDTMEEGNIVAWLKKVGDKVSPGDILAEVETDKATMELESFNEGYLLYISVKEGLVPVNGILAVIGEKDEDFQSLISETGNAKEEVKQPDKVKEEKEKPAQVVPEKEVISGKKNTEISTSASKESNQTGKNGPQVAERIKSSPLAKTIAAEAGIDITALKGTGDGGRIIKRDVESYVSSEQTLPTTSKSGDQQFKDVPLSQMRKTIAKRLVESKFSAPHYYLTIKINVDKTAEARKFINDTSDVKISFNDFVIKGCAVALKLHPAINSSWLSDKIRINKDINIGVAVAVDEGLLVPVLFGADQMGLREINSQIGTLAEKARQKKLQPQEMQGNTFTVSNLGMFGIDEFTAIINPPDAAIMAVGTISEELSLLDGKVSSSKIMKVTLSCDHRVIDGATGSRFLQTFKQLIENPVSMLV